jgi:DUF2075 family protein
MIVYSATKEEFLTDVDQNRIDSILLANFKAKLGRTTSASEIKSWRNSLPYMATILRDEDIHPKVGVSIECQIPQTANRIDFIVSGQDKKGADHAVIVELKQWEAAEKTESDGLVITQIGRGRVRTNHPSYKAWSYSMLLEQFNEEVYEGCIAVRPCAYLHNCRASADLTDPVYSRYLERAPLFLREDVDRLRAFVKQFVCRKDANQVMYRIDRGRIRPSKALADAVGGLLRGREEFILIDEQKVVFEEALRLVRKARNGAKQVLIVEGGPGTGKTVVAIHLLARLTSERELVHYVSKNSAPRKVYAELLAGEIPQATLNNLFKSSDSYVSAEKDTFGCLVVDEAHRLTAKSGFMGNLGENQIKEIISSARCSVFFLDEDQRISLKDIGNKDAIRDWSHKLRAEVSEMELPSQFRCNGSNGYLAWLDNTLGIRPTANQTLEDIDYDFRVFDNPEEMRQEIAKLNTNNKSRLLAGYCWPWLSKKNREAVDITFPEFGFAMKWNLDEDGQTWIIKPDSFKEIGCIHTCQSLELEYAGVIIGPDLRIGEDGSVVSDVSKRAPQDKTVRGWKKLFAKNEQAAYALTDTLIKDTYRVLMSRGMRGCFVYATDGALRDELRKRSRKTS